jgi:hypothetical protein
MITYGEGRMFGSFFYGAWKGVPLPLLRRQLNKQQGKYI